ncbi:hypothetical protein DPMN_039528 [Dreissena polymorpha]|uniref:Uncharacterized protein n=1 Tax=Dreissena polymorpha TaxID=45954 RepID=A0A9D4HUG4_DREPO|nr:hypothetical protein DPMN_039528 [Dreissena polymorpha]
MSSAKLNSWFDVSNSWRTTVSYLRHMRYWDKTLCAFIVGVMLASATSRSVDELLDTFILVFLYAVWILICLPALYRRLSVRLIKDAILSLLEIFFADILIFGVYRTLRRYLSAADVSYEAPEQRGFVFVMNSIRLTFVAVCLLKSVPVIFNSLASKTNKRTSRKSRKLAW